MNPELLKREGSKIYLTDMNCFATVVRVSEEVITINTGTKKEPRNARFEIHEFDDNIKKGLIVSKSQVLFNDNGDFVGVKEDPSKIVADIREPLTLIDPTVKQLTETITSYTKPPKDFETAYINEKTGKFSREKKRGYTQIKFTKVKQTITLELDDEKIEELKKLGVL